ncbi:T9SS type B sorting domain-containing protein, partial [Flavobacterium granuli]
LPPTITVPTQQCYTGSNLTVNLSTLTTTYNGVKSYTVNNSAITGPTATFNGPGTYTLGIKDDNGCEAFVTYKIEKQLTAFARVTKELFCAAPINATIAVAITDGVAPYSYQMYVGGVSTGSLTPVTGSSFTASVSAGGTYSFVITDSNAVKCSVTTANVVVTTPSTPRAAFVQTNVSCNGGADGTITITGSNGVEPYLYSINNGVSFQASNYFTGLTDAGVYKVVVKDAKLCTSVAIPVDITQPTAVTARAVVTPFGCNTANTQQDAIVTLTPGGGTPGYKYSFNGGATYQASASFVVNAAKTINYVIQDANGCTASGSAVVTAYTPPTDMNLAVTPIYCNTPGTVATLTVNSVTGGVAPYTYGIISPIVSATNTTGTFSNLAPNTYIVKVTDANGCSTTKAILIKKANNISVIAQLINDVSCRGGFNGAVNFTVSNYITAGSYSFGLTPAAGAFTKTGDIIKYTGLPAGNYTFNVTDGVSGCVASVTNFTISQPAAVLDFTAVATNINCDVKTSLITVTATGGTVSYSYAAVPTGTGAPTAYSADNRLLVDTNNGTVMGWDVYVKDRNGCSLSKLKTILLDVTPMITSAVATQCPSSTGTYNITVSATGFSTALQYSVGGVSFQTGNIITVNTPGNYNVIVKDANGCSSAPTAVTILDPLQLKFDITTSPICNGNEGVVTLTVTGGTVAANYVYSKDNWVTSQSSPVFAGLIPNMYIFSVRDTGTACTKSVTAVIETPNRAIDFTLPKTDVICKGESNGTVTVAMATTTTTVNNNPVYTYAISPSPIGMVLVGNVFTNLPANTYTVTVTSGKGCPVSKVVTVGEPLAISVATPIVTEYGCTTGNGTNYATISVGLPTGGSGTYTVYEFLRDGNPNPVQKGVNPVYIESDLLGGNYIINVYDNRGCVGTTSTTIDAFIGIDFATPSSINVTKAITCINDEDIQVNVVIKGGAPVPLDYTIVASATNAKPYASVTNTSGQFTNLTVGSYIITVKNPSTGCSIKTIHYVNEPNTFDLAVSNIKNVVCYGSATGSVDLNFVDNQLVPTNDAGVFDYTIAGPVSISARSTDAGPITIPNLPAGVYTVTAKLVGLPSCDVVTTFTIDQPTLALTISENHTPITCDPGNDGTISVTADGGWPGTYQYELVGPVNVAYSTDFYFDNLKAGTYILNVKDVNGCVATTTVTLSVPSPILVSASATSSLLLCNGDTSGEIRVNTPTGGQGSNYSYILNYASANPVISSAPQTSPVFSGLGAGTYTITVIDGLGCVSAPSADIIIAEPTKVEASLVLATAITCLSSATVTLSVTGGTGPYEYSTDKNFAPGSLTTLTSVPFSVGLGDHQYYVRDVNGCVGFISNTVKINALTPLSLDLDLSNAIINCNGAATGAIDSKAFGGLGNYVYTLLNATKNPISPAQATGYFDALLAGTYYVRVDSGDCQYDSDVITIAQPTTALGTVVTTTPVTCNGIGNGTIVVIGSGGTNPIGYAISPNLNQYFDTGSFINLKPGVYDIVTQDKNGCFVKDQATITEPNLIVANVVPSSIQQEICVGEKTGAFDITIVGGIPPYSTSIDGDPFVPNRITFSGLSGGNHMVIVKDANLCESELEVPLDKAVILNPVAMVSNECVNNSPANKVIVEIDESNNAADVTYSLDDTGIEQVSNVFTNLAPGDHYVMVHHKNTCIDATEAFTIDQIDPLTISIDLGGLNEIVATVTGGSGIYQYMINGESIGSNNKYFYYRSGDYTVTVIDSNGCSASITKYFEFIDIKIPPIFTPTGDGTNDSWKPTNTENYPDIKFVVYDRYGREVGVFGAGQSWDGKYNGTELPMGDYWYVLKLRHTQDDREFIGHFTLYR